MISEAITLLCFISVAVSQSDLEKTCEEQLFERKGYAFGTCYIVDWSKKATFHNWQDQCNHLAGYTGHPALLLSTIMVEWIKNTVMKNAAESAWLGLIREDISGDALTNWVWLKGDNYTTIPEIHETRRWTTDPTTTTENCAIIDSNGKFTENTCTDATKAFVCAYDEPRYPKRFILEAEGKLGATVAKVAETVLTNSEAAGKRMACGSLCGKRSDCYAFSVDDSSGDCKMFKDIILDAPTTDANYKLYKQN